MVNVIVPAGRLRARPGRRSGRSRWCRCGAGWSDAHGTLNVIADRVAALSHAGRPEIAREAERAAAPRRPGSGAGQGGRVVDLRALRAAAPPPNSFGRGRR